MERQLKERLIGAAVLVAAAVVMVPEMFSGPREAVAPETDSRPATNQIKTYRVELQSSQSAATVETPVEPPAERPVDEAQAMQANPEVSEALTTTPPSTEQKQPTVVEPPNKGNAIAATPVDPASSAKSASAKPETTKPTSPKADDKSTTGGWVVQVGSFSAQDTAQQIVSKLKGQGFPAFIGSIKVNGKTLYRVRVGAMADRASADAALQKLHASYPGASVVPAGR